jgi:uroporphyrin-III C-methyltransferase
MYGCFGKVLYFHAHGYDPLIMPGVSSALAGPTVAGVPVTQHGIAELLVCTGIGQGGKDIKLPPYVHGQTVLVLMGVARLAQMVRAFIGVEGEGEDEGKGGLEYPAPTPIAIIERASMPDQCVIELTLRHVGQVMESVGEQCLLKYAARISEARE